jgi:protein TonB
MFFKIDKEGKVIGIKVKAPHKSLEKEAERILKMLPVMKPGKQRGKEVTVKYTLPMRIDVK